jgi:hypothetical protein
MKTPSACGETARTRFGAKNSVFSPKNTYNTGDMGKNLKRHKFIPSLTYVQNFVEKLRAVSEIWPGQILA